MIIQWYPGHMYKAGKEIIQRLPEIDLVIEILDARIPFSSQNPLLKQMAAHKPSIKVLNKADLADAQQVKQWQNQLEKNTHIKTIALTTKQPEKIHSIVEMCRKICPNKGEHQVICAMIMGIPNVGKSTLINILAQRIVAKTGNEPAVTKGQQRIKVADDLVLFDTPGMLWPRIEHEHWALRLAITGAIKETATNHEDIVYYLIHYLMQVYPQVLKDRFQIDELGEDEYAVLAQIGAKRGCLKAGKRLDVHKVASIIIHEYRAGNLGKICLETPNQVEQEQIQAQALTQQRAAKKAARKNPKPETNTENNK